MQICKVSFLSVCLLFSSLVTGIFAQETVEKAADQEKTKTESKQSSEKADSKQEDKAKNKIVVKKRTPSEHMLPANTRSVFYSQSNHFTQRFQRYPVRRNQWRSGIAAVR